MTKRCVGIANRSETDEKEVKVGRVGLLPYVSRTQVKAHVHKQDLAYAGPFPRTYNLKNRHAYTRIDLHTHNVSCVHKPVPTNIRTQIEVVI